VDNYFNYFTEIEEHFQRHRNSTLLLSTLDWALIETWKDAGIPLEAVLRGIDSTFQHYAQRPARSRKINGLAFCSQEVLTAAEDMKEAAVGTAQAAATTKGIEANEIVAFLLKNAEHLESAELPEGASASPRAAAAETARTLRELADTVAAAPASNLEDLERRLTVLEEKFFAVLLAAAPDEILMQVRAAADRELAPYRRKMPAAQIVQLHKQFVNKRLLEQHALPRLSLFYM
jgi:hypothetical protein